MGVVRGGLAPAYSIARTGGDEATTRLESLLLLGRRPLDKFLIDN